MFPELYHGYTGEEVGDLCPEQHWQSWDSQVQRAVQGDEGCVTIHPFNNPQGTGREEHNRKEDFCRSPSKG